jgi:hypothetical protein
MWMSNIFDADFVVPLMIFSVPIVAIIGGIVMGVVKSLSQQRALELAQQERIAAIQAGVDPSKLPPMPVTSDSWNDASSMYRSFDDISRRRSQGLMIGGLVTLFTGVGLTAMLIIMQAGENSWAVGLVPGFIGLALLISGMLVRPRGRNGSSSGPPQS